MNRLLLLPALLALSILVGVIVVNVTSNTDTAVATTGGSNFCDPPDTDPPGPVE